MSISVLGTLLIWAGTLALVAVLQYRIRQGAWSAKSLETPPPIARWSAVVAAIGMIAAASGIALTVWSFL